MSKRTSNSLPAPVFDDVKHHIRLYHGDCLEILEKIPESSVDLVFADPPYFLSNGGITCHAGKMVSVHKGDWDKLPGGTDVGSARATFNKVHEFNTAWLAACQRVLKPNGSIWVSGTAHVIHSVGFAMQQLGFKLLNDISWVKPNPPPNLSCRYFTHATETIIWAAKNKKSRHTFNYKLMKVYNHNKQMKSVWEFKPPEAWEKKFGKHPTQNPSPFSNAFYLPAQTKATSSSIRSLAEPQLSSPHCVFAAAHSDATTPSTTYNSPFAAYVPIWYRWEFLSRAFSFQLIRRAILWIDLIPLGVTSNCHSERSEELLLLRKL